jgi:polynucleotide 5'-kinase involved in rRNA processing
LVARVTQTELIDRLVASRGTIALLGGLDTGKTSFGLGLAEAARARGISVAYVDADIGQSTIGPPTCVGLKFCTVLEKVDAGTVAKADELGFVGSHSPEGHLLPLVSSTARLVHRAREAGCEIVVVDTSAMVSGVYAEILKYHKLDLVRPSSVVGLQRGQELDPILGVVSRFLPAQITVLRVESSVMERSAEERLASRERSLAAHFTPPLFRWRVKRTVFMPSLPPDTDLKRLDGLVVGLEDGKGRCRGIGLLEYDGKEKLLRMVSSVQEGARGLRLGSMRITPEGKTLGRVTVRELFGN